MIRVLDRISLSPRASFLISILLAMFFMRDVEAGRYAYAALDAVFSLVNALEVWKELR
jgi:hypothetical protein